MSITSFEPRNFSFAMKTTPDNLGPGIYNPDAKFQRYKAPIPFGSTTRRELFPQKDDYSVGPGDYEPQLQVRSRSANAQFSLSSDRKYFEDNAKNPSPADYAPITVWGQRKYSSKLSYSKPPKYASHEPPKNSTETPLPGPGQYDPKVERSKKASLFSLSRAPQREPVYYNGVPGPAAYTIENPNPNEGKQQSAVFRTKMKREIFNTKDKTDGYMLEHKAWPAVPMTMGPFGGRTKRILNYGPVETPETVGPGAYEPKFQVQKPKINRGTFGVDHDLLDGIPKSNPGPGYYGGTTEFQKAPSGAMARAERPDIWNPKITPSPGQYEPYETESIQRKSLMKIGNPAFKNKEERDCLTNKQPNPGPAAYAVKVASSQGKKFPKGPRFTKKNYVGTQNMNDAPSPANYTIEPEGKQKHGFVFTKGNRFHQKDQEIPAPDSYQRPTKDSLVKHSWNVQFGYSPSVDFGDEE
ncbi:hypothetical protein TRFO_04777 [Tritrichomonas foetus]|uniref:Uncharacterized protein n=1 Tax=Tritrichomonas foetus TaxID=1144522 RepID=A0A1J4KBA8_9EUKA|nr:hypothetical protein TRFO_04777 [Tritrichomonas foetus]|eukprot:OHT08705.1 hypothetical protein TRFO_04777 [Tritrichomonas foetus]